MVFEFKIQIRGISRPPVWRTIRVPANFSFEKFHEVIQASFGWYNCHLYSFSPDGYNSWPTIEVPHETDDIEALDSRKTKLSEIFVAKEQQFSYTYDFGDDWLHKIKLQDIIDTSSKKAELISGKGKCPPEDCGGVRGYQELLKSISDPQHPEYNELRDWLGLEEEEIWDPEDFNISSAKAEVARV